MLCLVHLAGSDPAGASNVAAEQNRRRLRSEFIDRVSEPVLHKLLDKLLERRVITEGEMEEIAAERFRADKARHVFDSVQKKGSEASSALISALCQVDPWLSSQLNLEPQQFVPGYNWHRENGWTRCLFL